MKTPILKGKKVKTRILRPEEFELLREGAPSIPAKTLLDGCLLMGARYEEARKIQKNPDWFDGNFIHLPSEAQLKGKRTQPERWIRLSSMGKTILPYFLPPTSPILLPSVRGWNKRLHRWAVTQGLDPIGISSKTLRKTYESWLLLSFPNATNLVFLSQGHTMLVSLKHYAGLPFTEEDIRDMKRWVEGWI